MPTGDVQQGWESERAANATAELQGAPLAPGRCSHKILAIRANWGISISFTRGTESSLSPGAGEFR